MMNQFDTQKIIITGDATMDWNLACSHRSKSIDANWNSADSTSTTWQRGGSALLADLISAIAQDLLPSTSKKFTILQNNAPKEPANVLPESNLFNHSYTLWSSFKYAEKSPLDKEKPSWRVEEFLGLHRADRNSIQEWQYVVGDDPNAGIIVLDDANLGFRDHKELFPAALNSSHKSRPWIIHKICCPLAQGSLWENLHRNFADHLIAVATVSDLRLSEVQISQAISWERTAQDVFWELIHNPCINSLSDCAHVVISFGPAGAILLSKKQKNKSSSFSCTLFFDPKVNERSWEKAYPGGMVGYTTCLIAGIARQLMLSSEQPDLPSGIQNGLSAMRVLHMEGYGERGQSVSQVKLLFPISKVVNALGKSEIQFSQAEVQNPVRFISQKLDLTQKPLVEGFWTILQTRFQTGLDKVAELVVSEGPETALKDVPWCQFGNLLTVDRQEIESYRSIGNLVSEYAEQKQVIRPLSIAVFGTPGSGKSFGVTELAKTLLPGKIEPITFNLSQFDSTNDLNSAFHQVRDIALGEKIPLVFWDEFDTTFQKIPLGWLRYFLAPMQDGKFQEGQITHPIGRAIFIFAGGTSSKMAEFIKGDDETFKLAKGPDFISRLKGYINILGPNPIMDTRQDPYFIIRRAILLRSSLRRNAAQLFSHQDKKELLNIDRGVLRALLKIDRYKHGARSIESIFTMSQLVGKTNFERSCLPPETQLDLHVNGRLFLSLVQEIELEGKTLEDLAQAAHEVFCEDLCSRGYRYGSTTDDNQKTHNALLPFSELPEDLKEMNRALVRDIPGKLAVSHYIMLPARSNEPPFNFPGDALETLAEAEHDRWMKAKSSEGWIYDAVTNREKKTHNCLIDWKKLPEGQKNKDRELVRCLPVILSKAGYTIVKMKN